MFPHQCEEWNGDQQFRSLLRCILVNQGFTIKPSPMPSKIINRSNSFKICFFESALDQCFQTHIIILQTGKLAFLPGSQGMEREREEQNYGHCLWRKNKVLACLSVALWLGNTVLHLKMPMVSWLCKSWCHMFQYHSQALWTTEDSVFRSSPVLTQSVFPWLGMLVSERPPISCCLGDDPKEY